VADFVLKVPQGDFFAGPSTSKSISGDARDHPEASAGGFETITKKLRLFPVSSNRSGSTGTLGQILPFTRTSSGGEDERPTLMQMIIFALGP
jgi:hypothetical protein